VTLVVVVVVVVIVPLQLTCHAAKSSSHPLGMVPQQVNHKFRIVANVHAVPTSNMDLQQKQKRQTITPSQSSPTASEVTRLVVTVTQSQLVSTLTNSPQRSAKVEGSYHQANTLLKCSSCSENEAEGTGFKLDDKTIYTWFRNNVDPFSPKSSSSLKKKAQNNFGRILHKERQVLAGEGKSQQIATNTMSNKPTKVKGTKSKLGQLLTAALPCSIMSTSTIEKLILIGATSSKIFSTPMWATVYFCKLHWITTILHPTPASTQLASPSLYNKSQDVPSFNCIVW
jgi:hypothetical protein